MLVLQHCRQASRHEKGRGSPNARILRVVPTNFIFCCKMWCFFFLSYNLYAHALQNRQQVMWRWSSCCLNIWLGSSMYSTQILWIRSHADMSACTWQWNLHTLFSCTLEVRKRDFKTLLLLLLSLVLNCTKVCYLQLISSHWKCVTPTSRKQVWLPVVWTLFHQWK